jgi:hypothetical protein
MNYPQAPLSAWQLYIACIKAYVPLLKRIWPVMVIVALLGYANSLLKQLPIMWILLASVIVLFLISAFLYATALHQSDAVLRGSNTTWRDSFRAVAKRYGAFLVNHILVSVLAGAFLACLLGALIGVGGKELAAAYPTLPTPMPSLPPTMTLLLFIFAIVFMIITVILLLAPTLTLLKEKPIFSALQTSSDLVKGHWWHVFGVIFMVAVLATVILALLDWGFSHQHIAVISQLSNIIFSILFYPLPLAVLLLVLNDLQLRQPK